LNSGASPAESIRLFRRWPDVSLEPADPAEAASFDAAARIAGKEPPFATREKKTVGRLLPD